MKAIVTGGAGFIGSHLTDLLLENGIEVVVIDSLVNGQLKNLEEAQKNPKFSFYEIDITRSDELLSIFEKLTNIDWVFHLAALADIVPSIENPRKYFETNVDGTFNVLEAAKKVGIKRFIYSASSSCYGIPKVYPTPETASISCEYPYALSKFLGEELVMHFAKVYKLPSLSLRFFNVYGPRARTTGTYGAVFGVFLAQKLNNKPFTVVGDGNQTRDFTYVSDIVEALFDAAKSNLTNEIFNVGSSSHYSVNELVKLLDGESIYIPKRPGEPDCTFADISKIKQMLSWKPKTSFKEGVNKLLLKIDEFKEAPVWDQENIANATKNWFKYLSKTEK
ncbi:MAG: UDP-glucose 4-epimerase [Candidatus Anoxychlamydiales bacterium]|nr:UDP-glucose 4-epimerase [Candidatus Anoxychlamydiales bacterium]